MALKDVVQDDRANFLWDQTLHLFSLHRLTQPMFYKVLTNCPVYIEKGSCVLLWVSCVLCTFISLQKEIGCFRQNIPGCRLIASSSCSCSSSHNHNTLEPWPQNILWGNHLLALRAWPFHTATLKCICNDSFTDVMRVVIVLWLSEYCGCKMNCTAASWVALCN